MITPATMLLNRPVPSGLTRTTESHRTFGPMTGVRPAKRGVPRPRSTPMMYSPPIACVGAIGPAISAVEDQAALVLEEVDLVSHHVQARILRPGVAGEEVPDRIRDDRRDGAILQGFDLRAAWKIAGQRSRAVAATSEN